VNGHLAIERATRGELTVVNGRHFAPDRLPQKSRASAVYIILRSIQLGSNASCPDRHLVCQLCMPTWERSAPVHGWPSDRPPPPSRRGPDILLGDFLQFFGAHPLDPFFFCAILAPPSDQAFSQAGAFRALRGVSRGRGGTFAGPCRNTRQLRTTRDNRPSHNSNNDNPQVGCCGLPLTPALGLRILSLRGAGSTPAVRIGVTWSRSVGLRLDSHRSHSRRT
jgi:hypothetical protein